MSEEGETASRGHPSAQFALSPRRTRHHPEGNTGGLQGTCLLPTAVGVAGLARSKIISGYLYAGLSSSVLIFDDVEAALLIGHPEKTAVILEDVVG